MVVRRTGKASVIVLISGLHLVQGILLYLANHTADGVSTMASLVRVFGPSLTPYTLMMSAMMAFLALAYVDYKWSVPGLLLKIPQMIILVAMAIGSMQYAYQQSYADGTLRNFYFIMIDQLPPIALAVIYAVCL